MSDRARSQAQRLVGEELTRAANLLAGAVHMTDVAASRLKTAEARFAEARAFEGEMRRSYDRALVDFEREHGIPQARLGRDAASMAAGAAPPPGDSTASLAPPPQAPSCAPTALSAGEALAAVPVDRVSAKLRDAAAHLGILPPRPRPADPLAAAGLSVAPSPVPAATSIPPAPAFGMPLDEACEVLFGFMTASPLEREASPRHREAVAVVRAASAREAAVAMEACRARHGDHLPSALERLVAAEGPARE